MQTAFRLVVTFATFNCLGVSVHGQAATQQPKFAICYNPDVSPNKLAPYKLVVVDFSYPASHITALREQGKTVFGYLSLGKVQNQRPFAAEVKRLGIRFKLDPSFPDSYQIDVSDPNWSHLVLTGIVPQMKRIGFNGIFLDDLDDIKSRKMVPSAVSLIRGIRQANPELKLMANRGLDYLKDVAPFVDYSLLESCFALKGQLRDPKDSAWAIGLLNEGKKRNPDLHGVAVDYMRKKAGALSPSQLQIVAQIRKLHADNGLSSFVSTEDLQAIPGF